MKIVFISDTHRHHRKVILPEGDILIHCGDITSNGEIKVIEDFADWMGKLNFSHKISIFGNHEVGCERGEKRKYAIAALENNGIIYLEDSGIDINGVKFWGSPISPFFFDWEFNRQRGKDIAVHWNRIPNDVNVIITHGPPFGILDKAPRGLFDYEHVGCKDLLARIKQLKQLKVHAFGHIHRDNNEAPLLMDGVKFCNASIANNRYEMVNNPIVIDI